MSCKDYIDLKPGMEVLLSYEPWGYKDVHAIIESVDVEYSYDEENNCGVFHPLIVCYVGKYRMIINGPSVWETLEIKQCKKVYVKDLRVGDVIERNNQRGFVKSKYDDEVGVIWYNTVDTHCYITCYGKEIKDVEVVGHVDLWNLESD